MHTADHEQGATALQPLMLQKGNLLMSEHNKHITSLVCQEWESQGSSCACTVALPVSGQLLEPLSSKSCVYCTSAG